MSKTFFYWLLGFRRFSAQEYDKEILNFRIDVSPMLFSATEKSYEQVDNNRFCSCSICSSLWFVKYNGRFCNRRQKKMYIKWFGFEPKKQRNTTRLQVVTLNQGHSLWFFSSFLPILLRNSFLSWVDPFSQPTLRKKKRLKNVDNSIWAFMRSLTQVVMSHVVERVRFFKLFCKLSSINPKCVKSKDSMNVKIKVSLMPWF